MELIVTTGILRGIGGLTLAVSEVFLTQIIKEKFGRNECNEMEPFTASGCLIIQKQAN